MSDHSNHDRDPAVGDDEFVPVFTTGKPLQFDMAVDLLKQVHFPYQTREETATGLHLSMPVLATPGPGAFWSILVPGKALSDARRVLSELPFPITTNPDPWDFLPPMPREAAEADTRVYRWLIAILFLTISLGGIAYGCVTLAVGRDRDRGDAIGTIVFGLVVLIIVSGLIWHSWRWLESHEESTRLDHRDRPRLRRAKRQDGPRKG